MEEVQPTLAEIGHQTKARGRSRSRPKKDEAMPFQGEVQVQNTLQKEGNKGKIVAHEHVQGDAHHASPKEGR